MQVSSVKENEKITVSVSGRIDTGTAPELEKYVLENIAGFKELTIDMAQTEYVSSAGLRSLLQIQKQMKKQGAMRFINMSNDLMEIFDMIGFSNIFTIE